MHTVLLVEDDDALREATALVLERQGFTVRTAADGLQAVRALEEDWPDVALVDLMMPGMDGLSLTRWIRERSELPVVIITARGDPIDQITGLETGADDYVVKPFDGAALAARLRAVLRRAGGGAHAGETGGDAGVQHIGDLALDRAAMEVRRDGEVVALTPTELRLLIELADNPGVALSRTVLLERVWGSMWAGAGAGRTVDVHVQRLRNKVGQDVVETVRGYGYRLRRG